MQGEGQCCPFERMQREDVCNVCVTLAVSKMFCMSQVLIRGMLTSVAKSLPISSDLRHIFEAECVC